MGIIIYHGWTEEDLKEDFKKFLAYAWNQLNLPPPTKVQYAIADFLQDWSHRTQTKMEAARRRKIIQAFRGVGKSWITSVYCAWRWYKNANYRILVVSASKMRSDDFTTFTLRIIQEFPILQYLTPDKGLGDRSSKTAFDVRPAPAAHAPSCKSLGVFSQLAGSRADEVIADDVEVPNNSATQDLREKLLKTAMEFEAIMMPDTGKITYLGTPQTEESVYNKLNERGYERRIWPARFPQIAQDDIYKGQLCPTIGKKLRDDPALTETPTDAKRFNSTDLSEREAAYGKSAFALQFMLDTSLSDALKYPLKTSDIIVTSVDLEKAPVAITYGSGSQQRLDNLRNVGFTGDKWYGPMYYDQDRWTEYKGRAMSIDPAGRGADETAYAVGYMLHGNIWVPEVGGLMGGYDNSTLVALAKVAKKHKVNHIIVESNFGDGMFTSLFQPILNNIHKCRVEEVRHTTQKEKRIIDTLEPPLNQHRIIFDQTVVEKDVVLSDEDLNRSLFYQMTRLTSEKGALKHDDRLDALAIMVRYWLDALQQDSIRSKKAWERREVDKELKSFMKHAKGTNWNTNRRTGGINSQR
jgi:hypothetical protein